MCQRNNIQKRFTAGTICYKVLYNSYKFGYLSIYQRTSWNLGQTHKAYFYSHKLNSSEVKKYCSSSGNIGPGFFHAFPTLEDAIQFQKTIWKVWAANLLYIGLVIDFPIAEMRIPEDVDGFSGTYFDHNEYFDSITVPILEFVKIVDQNVSDK